MITLTATTLALMLWWGWDDITVKALLAMIFGAMLLAIFVRIEIAIRAGEHKEVQP